MPIAGNNTMSASEGAIPLEVIVFDRGNALRAESVGAQRVELNAKGSYSVGGLTPPVQLLRDLRQPAGPGDKKLDIPVRIMIRPRPAPAPDAAEPHDFIYSDDEFDEMRDAITEFKQLGALNPLHGDAFVFGILKRVGTGAEPVDRELAVDVRRCSVLVEHAKPVPCVFHRAFDALATEPAWRENLDELALAGFSAVLTSGGPGNFTKHVDRLLHFVSHRPEVQLIVGGGLRSSNARLITDRIANPAGLNLWMHSSCQTGEAPEGRDPEDLDANELKALTAVLGQNLTG